MAAIITPPPDRTQRLPHELVRSWRHSTICSPPTEIATTSPILGTPVYFTPASQGNDSDTSVDSVVPKVEEPDENALHGLPVEDAKPIIASGSTVPRKRGRPRKHPIVESKKTINARSKTGCGTCRRRKKKCDEAKPSCLNCEKNNVVCDGYEPKQLWQSGKQKAVMASRRASIVPPELPLLVEGVDGPIDQLFFQHFTSQLVQRLSLIDQKNPYRDPFREYVVPMAVAHAGLMHSVLYLSGSCLIAENEAEQPEWLQRQKYHGSNARLLLHQDLAQAAVAAGRSGDADSAVSVPSIAQALMLCLQTVCSGNLSGDYRCHLSGMKNMLLQRSTFPNEHLRQFLLEFLVYHDHGAAITSLTNPLDQRSSALMEDFTLPEYMLQPPVGTLLGVLDGLFGFLSKIRQLRDEIRAQRARAGGGGHWWDAHIMSRAFRIDAELKAWQCRYAPDSPRYVPSLLYRQCTYLYLQRSIQPSRPCAWFRQGVDQGLELLRHLPWTTDTESTQSILLMPLFLLGVSAFEAHQRPAIAAAFGALREWSHLGNIKHAFVIVEEIWGMMDQGREEETWDWEGIIARRGWDFLVT